MKNIIICIILLCPFVMRAQQQQQSFTVSGTVIDGEGLSMPEAYVYLKERPGVGTQTDTDGKFTIKASKGDIIVFSFSGYDDIQHIAEKEEKDLQIVISNITMMDEVVVTGLSSQRKVSVVGAITSVKVSEIQTPATSLVNMLGGRVPGIITMQSSGEPGKNLSEFWIRGIGTFGANSNALVLVDGLEGDLNSIDPADIESFTILKDASATAVYGVRGANGVVIVTTKRGLSGRLKISARANLTLSHINKMPEYLQSYDYALLANEARMSRGDEPLYNSTELSLIQTGLDPDLYPNVNWQDEIMRRSSLQQTYYLSGQGGGEIARYFVSVGMSDESAAYKVDKSNRHNSNVGYNTYNYRTNIDINVTKTTQIYFGADGHLALKNQPGIINTDYLWEAQARLTPLTIPKMYSTGHIPAYGPENAYSPYVMLNHTGSSTYQDYKGKVTLALTQDLSFITDGLKLKVQGAYDNKSHFYERRYVLPEMYAATGRNVKGELQLVKKVDAVSANYSKSEWQYRKYHFEGSLNYEKLINESHRVAGLIYYYMSDEKTSTQTENTSLNASMAAIPKRYQGISSKLSYGYKDTYLIDVNFGYTGSENFEPGKQFGFFPSVAAGWVPTQYDWVRDNVKWLTYLKIRGSYGTVGNDRITSGRFPYLTLVAENGATGWSSTGWFNTGGGISETSIGADNLKWEKSTKADIGIEARFLNDKINLVVDLFQDQRDGIFQRRAQIPDYAGLMAMPFGNVGKMRSYGSDGNISFSHSINEDLSFVVRANYTYSKNEIQNWEEVIPKYSYQSLSNMPYNAIRGYVALGLFRDDQDVTSSPTQSFGIKTLPGDIKYKDINGDGQVNTDDKVPLSNATSPRLMYGFGGEIKYKNLTLGVLFKGTGNTDFYHVGYNGNGMGYLPFHGEDIGNVLTIVGDQNNRWTSREISGDPSTENPNARFPRLTYGHNGNNSQLSSWWKGNAKYLRLQEVTLNYNLRQAFLGKVGLKSVDIQLVGSNICVWDNVKLWDPEQAHRNGEAYPIPSRYTLQLYFNF